MAQPCKVLAIIELVSSYRACCRKKTASEQYHASLQGFSSAPCSCCSLKMPFSHIQWVIPDKPSNATINSSNNSNQSSNNNSKNAWKFYREKWKSSTLMMKEWEESPILCSFHRGRPRFGWEGAWSVRGWGAEAPQSVPPCDKAGAARAELRPSLVSILELQRPEMLQLVEGETAEELGRTSACSQAW